MNESITQRVARTSNIKKEFFTVVPPVPKSVKIEITGHCDLRCDFCAVSYKKRINGNIDEQLLYRLLKEVKEAGVEEVGLFWMGEPFINKNLAKYIRYAKDIGIKYVFITTNGRLANAKRIKEVFESGLDSIKFSINAPNKVAFENTTGVDCYNLVLENIKLAKQVRGKKTSPAIYSSSVYDPREGDQYNEAHNLVSPYVDKHYPLRLYGNKTYKKNDTADSYKYEENRDLKSMLPCWSLFIEPHISYDLFMSACFCDFNPNLFMADLKQMSFMEGWHSSKFQSLRKCHLEKDILGTPCQSCIAYQ